MHAHIHPYMHTNAYTCVWVDILVYCCYSMPALAGVLEPLSAQPFNSNIPPHPFTQSLIHFEFINAIVSLIIVQMCVANCREF